MKRLQVSGIAGVFFGEMLPLARQTVRLGCLALSLLLSSSAVSADPVRVQFGGVSSGGDDTGFSLFGPNVEFMVSHDLEPIVTCNPCVPGTPLDLSSTLIVQDWPAGRAVVDGVTYESVYFSGTFNFDAGSVIIPDMPPGSSLPGGDEVERRFTNFTFMGTLAGFADPALTGTPLFSTQLTGGGGPFGVSVEFENLSAATGTRVYEIIYNFENTAPTPEPGSLLLFGSGAAWVAARWRKRRQSVIRG
jgi:hypothetical protein